jgi:trk system potassium uptake protein
MKSSFYSISLRDIRISFKDLALIMRFSSFAMLLPLIATFWFGRNTTPTGFLTEAWAFIAPFFVLYCLYFPLRILGLDEQSKTKHLMITVGLAWLIIGTVGSLPFMIRGTLGPLDSFFESMSGWTTTGISMIQYFENTDRDILFYRGLMEGIGGLGVITLGMLVLLQGGRIGVGYTDVGVTRIKASIRHTVVEAWKIYWLYILLGVVLLYIAGMNLFDAINHSMAAIATGGFSTHASIGYYNSFPIELALMVLMFLGMTSFVLHYHLFNGEYSSLRGEELRYFLAILVVSVIVISVSLWGKTIPGLDTFSVFDILRKVSFYVVSGMSTCGFNSIDYSNMPDFAKTWMIGLMYVGGMNSSAGGGIRVIRFIILLKAVHYCLKKMVLPKTAILGIKVDRKPLQEDIIMVVGYSAIYLMVCLILSFALMPMGYSAIDSISTIMASMGNDALRVIPNNAWYTMPDLGKLDIILAMWVGRIEIYPGLLILRALLDRLRLV